jgi:hypothetical protein
VKPFLRTHAPDLICCSGDPPFVRPRNEENPRLEAAARMVRVRERSADAIAVCGKRINVPTLQNRMSCCCCGCDSSFSLLNALISAAYQMRTHTNRPGMQTHEPRHRQPMLQLLPSPYATQLRKEEEIRILCKSRAWRPRPSRPIPSQNPQNVPVLSGTGQLRQESRILCKSRACTSKPSQQVPSQNTQNETILSGTAHLS